jgi:hypothetical protein
LGPKRHLSLAPSTQRVLWSVPPQSNTTPLPNQPDDARLSQQQITIRLESQEAAPKEPQKLTAWKFHKANNAASHRFPGSDFEAFPWYAKRSLYGRKESYWQWPGIPERGGECETLERL